MAATIIYMKVYPGIINIGVSILPLTDGDLASGYVYDKPSSPTDQHFAMSQI